MVLFTLASLLKKIAIYKMKTTDEFLPSCCLFSNIHLQIYILMQILNIPFRLSCKLSSSNIHNLLIISIFEDESLQDERK